MIAIEALNPPNRDVADHHSSASQSAFSQPANGHAAAEEHVETEESEEVCSACRVYMSNTHGGHLVALLDWMNDVAGG